MPNIATTDYKITGSKDAVISLYKAFQKLSGECNADYFWLGKLAEEFSIDFKEKNICVRGDVCYFDYDDDSNVLSFMTETAWDACNELFWEINSILDDKLSISYRVTECGLDVFYVHDEGCFFPEECCVSADGKPFDNLLEEPFDTVKEAIEFWCEKMNVPQGTRSEADMIDFIHNYRYSEDYTYFYVHPFMFE